MIVECFLDTNILLYAASRNPAQAAKKKIAADLLQEKAFGLSAQVVQEFYAVATRKADFTQSSDQALDWVETLEAFPCLPLDLALIKNAAVLSARYRISYWDGAILAAAAALGAPLLYSEDLNHGQDYDGVRVVNPFRHVTQTSGFHEDRAGFAPAPAQGAAGVKAVTERR